MLIEYTQFLSRYSDFTEKLDKLEEGEMSQAELDYYAQVTLRVSQKLLSIGG